MRQALELIEPEAVVERKAVDEHWRRPVAGLAVEEQRFR